VKLVDDLPGVFSAGRGQVVERPLGGCAIRDALASKGRPVHPHDIAFARSGRRATTAVFSVIYTVIINPYLSARYVFYRSSHPLKPMLAYLRAARSVMSTFRLQRSFAADWFVLPFQLECHEHKFHHNARGHAESFGESITNDLRRVLKRSNRARISSTVFSRARIMVVHAWKHAFGFAQRAAPVLPRAAGPAHIVLHAIRKLIPSSAVWRSS